MPGLTPDVEKFLKSLLQNPQGALQGFGQPTSDLQRQLGDAFSNDLSQPSASSRTLDWTRTLLEPQLTGRPGQDVLDAANPIFQRNLRDSVARSGELGGRFSTANQRIANDLSQRALGDFNLFTQQTVEAGRQRQLQGFDLLGRLAGQTDQSRLGTMGAASQFDLGNRGLQGQGQAAQMQFLAQLLGHAFGAGGSASGPALINNPGTFAQITSGLGSIANLIAAYKGASPNANTQQGSPTFGASNPYGGGGFGSGRDAATGAGGFDPSLFASWLHR